MHDGSAKQFTICCIMRAEPKTFAAFSTCNFITTQGSTQYFYINTPYSPRFIHPSGLYRTSCCGPHKTRSILHNFGICRLQIYPYCWVAVRPAEVHARYIPDAARATVLFMLGFPALFPMALHHDLSVAAML
jgi:hypothetical protein